MALKPKTAPAKPAKTPPSAPGTWKRTMPGHISAEDAEAEPRHLRLFPDG
jgi:hypothetical protein